MYAKTLVLGGLVGLASAHIKMSDPVPYGASSLDNSPLKPDGSDFPCKGSAYNAEGASNVYGLGSSGNKLAFIGSAVHGGGSCQVSITYDAQPNANSVWKVIKSIEGGCPAQDQVGNMGDNAAQEVPYKYSFDIPSDIPAGNGTIAWTWFNKVGNREMYMNCGPVTLTGSGGSETAYSALPDMFRANIGNGCETLSDTDVEFPNAGQAVEKLNGATDAFKPPNGSCGPTGAPGSGNGNGGGSPAPTTAPPTTEAPTPTGGADGSAPTLPGGVFIPVPTAEAPAPTSAPVAPAPEEPSTAPFEPAPETPSTEEPAPVEPTPEEGAGSGDAAPQPEAPVITDPISEAPVQDTPETEAPVPPTDNNTATTPGSACANEGEWNCVGGTSFQRCASGAWSVVMQLAAGTSCEAGQSANINMIVTRNGRKRAIRSMSV
ncbi:hypothetical protein D7B24_009107 [Verticillium nonalfalfae]|uniref:Chitin-binding type-4 domain-containing protein n=1 Tax=Verticillium nonalfalfae TaxID=1051616 RepID=A0A3M9Y5E5_9PEZI|nr:uncharacterized protein D7B24_009107 [Verticillium nonalfalfae]RNJ55006.1 hypothetical protein D7B24_009107 [Verticillium nonalfalfae]